MGIGIWTEGLVRLMIEGEVLGMRWCGVVDGYPAEMLC